MPTDHLPEQSADQSADQSPDSLSITVDADTSNAVKKITAVQEAADDTAEAIDRLNDTLAALNTQTTTESDYV
jgi:hypothetical protein